MTLYLTAFLAHSDLVCGLFVKQIYKKVCLAGVILPARLFDSISVLFTSDGSFATLTTLCAYIEASWSCWNAWSVCYFQSFFLQVVRLALARMCMCLCTFVGTGTYVYVFVCVCDVPSDNAVP